jgi:hypothetical protein
MNKALTAGFAALFGGVTVGGSMIIGALVGSLATAAAFVLALALGGLWFATLPGMESAPTQVATSAEKVEEEPQVQAPVEVTEADVEAEPVVEEEQPAEVQEDAVAALDAPAPARPARPAQAAPASPPPQAAPPVAIAAQGASVTLINGGHRFALPSSVPPGNYAIEATFAGQPPFDAGQLVVQSGQSLSVVCNARMGLCRTRSGT